MLLIDSDTLAYVAAIMAEDYDESAVRYNVDKMLEDTLIECNDFNFMCFLTGKTNFRYDVYPEYKANRKDQPKPKYLDVARQRLIDEYKATVSDGCEADDLVSIEQYKRANEATVVHIDKDLNQIVGWHYNPRKKERYLVSPNDAIRFFYEQLLVGDTADNVKGAKGIGPKKAAKILDQCENEQEMFVAVRDVYGCDQELLMNAQVLWIQKAEGDIWKWPEWAEPMEEVVGN